MECPKCGYVRRPEDSHVMEGVCPKGGIAYLKWKARETVGNRTSAQPGQDAEEAESFTCEPLLPWWKRVLNRLAAAPEKEDSVTFTGQLALFVAFFFWGWSFILGGSLFQVLMPLGLMLVFILQRHDYFAASIMLWWSGQNFIDVSPYIADARHRALPLIMGMGEA